MTIAREGWPFVIVPALAAAAVWAAGRYFTVSGGAGCIAVRVLSGLLLLAVFACAFFFRDPRPVVTWDGRMVLSPADGRVMSVEDDEENGFMGGKCRVVRIFLSVFNVHVQRSPISGFVRAVEYRPGKFLPAMNPEAHRVNEQNFIGIEGSIRVGIRQIAGIIARRIVCRVRPGDPVSSGEKIGLIRFGSQVDVYLPHDAEMAVGPGDRVRLGETLLARVK